MNRCRKLIPYFLTHISIYLYRRKAIKVKEVIAFLNRNMYANDNKPLSVLICHLGRLSDV